METIKFLANGAEVIGYLHGVHPTMVYHRQRPAIVICPGGAYEFLCEREADPPALAFFSKGYNVFILRYSVGTDATGYRPLRQLSETVSTVRKNSDLWNIYPDRIAVMGFSAGGHLAASLGIMWHEQSLGLAEDCRPNAMILSYPVINLGEYAHEQSAKNVSGGDSVSRARLTLDLKVTPYTVPAFIWHAADDLVVPVENTMLLIRAMKREGVPFECHIFETGGHGISICNQESDSPRANCAPWVQLCHTWLSTRFQFVD